MCTEEMSTLASLVQEYCVKEDTDLFLFSGPIEPAPVQEFREIVLKKNPIKGTATLFLATHGGDANWAFRMARTLQAKYKGGYRILIDGPCKSAGTLVAIGAKEIGLGSYGELGPLDVQVIRPDEIFSRNSGLDLSMSLQILSGQAFMSFERYMLDITMKSGGTISTRTAAEIATEIVTGIYSPISGQIDPIRLGEIHRAMAVAAAYGERLASDNLKERWCIGPPDSRLSMSWFYD